MRDSERAEWEAELKGAGPVREIYPHIFLCTPRRPVYWCLDFWPDVERLHFDSISDATRKLKRIRRRWAYCGGALFRKGKLIADGLRIKPHKAMAFPGAADPESYAAFTLENESTLLYSLNPLKGKFAGGKVTFAEDRTGPPSRAYLKLWEIFTLTGFYPGPDDTVLDLGAYPGGWSYVADSLGARVTMIDRTRPDDLLKQKPQLNFIRGDGLNVPAAELEKATVLLSDMACEPVKLLASCREWLRLKTWRAMVCTLKFHGRSDAGVIREFAAIPGAKIYHLWHNGHELTWFYRPPVA